MAAFDHLVISADTLGEGGAWVEEVLGVPTEPGGQHDLMATHNRLLRLGEHTSVRVPEAARDLVGAARGLSCIALITWSILTPITLRSCQCCPHRARPGRHGAA